MHPYNTVLRALANKLAGRVGATDEELTAILAGAYALELLAELRRDYSRSLSLLLDADQEKRLSSLVGALPRRT